MKKIPKNLEKRWYEYLNKIKLPRFGESYKDIILPTFVIYPSDLKNLWNIEHSISYNGREGV